MDDFETLCELQEEGLAEIVDIEVLPLTEEQKKKSMEERKFIMNFKVSFIEDETEE